MSDERVPVITGIGLVTGLGIGKDTNWSQMVAGKSAVRPITSFDPSNVLTKIASELPKDFTAVVEKKISRMTRGRTTHFSQLALLGAVEAVEDSGIDLNSLDRERVGVILGNCLSGFEMLEQRFKEYGRINAGKTIPVNNILYDVIYKKMESLFGIKVMQNAMSAQVAIDFKLYGPNMVISTACAAGSMAVEIASDYIRRGLIDAAIAGGSEIFVTEFGITGFNCLTALTLRNNDPHVPRPFDKNRDGTVLGDGAGIMLIESEEHARKRGARIYARIRGYANMCEAYSLATPEPSGKGMALVMSKALESARLNPEQIDYISAHGTGTLHNDLAETNGIKIAFKEHAKKLMISSQKSMVGHTIGAAGGIEIAVSALSLYNGIVTPTINYSTPDPKCDLFYVPNESIKREIKTALSNSFALGGHNSCVILEKV